MPIILSIFCSTFFKKVDNKIDIDLNIIIVCKSIICHLAKSKTPSYFALISGRK